MDKKKIIFLLLSLISATSGFTEPKIAITETTFDFGKTVQHAKVNHTFWIKSTGDDTLVITKVVPGCGCTKAPLMDSVLAPGDSTSLDIIFSTKSYRGYVSKRPYFETNISDEKAYLKIFAELIPEPENMMPISITPYKLDVSQFSEKPRRRAKFLIENKGDRDFDIKLIDGSDKYFDVSLPKSVKAGETVEGMITVHKDAIKNEFEQSLTFEVSNNEELIRYSIPVKRTYRILKRDSE
ncbi:MAG: DUF1573 domain-containing protein [Candidatus Zixiibacteriota bacterium]